MKKKIIKQKNNNNNKNNICNINQIYIKLKSTQNTYIDPEDIFMITLRILI
jgi:hypothetical protein